MRIDEGLFSSTSHTSEVRGQRSLVLWVGVAEAKGRERTGKRNKSEECLQPARLRET